jgi:hypothetical protein
MDEKLGLCQGCLTSFLSALTLRELAAYTLATLPRGLGVCFPSGAQGSSK